MQRSQLCCHLYQKQHWLNQFCASTRLPQCQGKGAFSMRRTEQSSPPTESFHYTVTSNIHLMNDDYFEQTEYSLMMT